MPVCKSRKNPAASSSTTPFYGSGKTTHGFPNLKDDATLFAKGEKKPSSFDAQYWYKRIKEQMKVRFAEPPVVG